MKRVSLLVFICLVLAVTATACRTAAATPDPAAIERLVAEGVQATIEAMPTATPYPTYTPVPPAPTCPPPGSVSIPRTTHTAAVASGTSSGSQSSAAFRTHVVVAGNTLSELAKEYGTTVEAIMAANGLTDAGLIIVDQVLSIPAGEAEPVSTPVTSGPSLTPETTLTPTGTTPTETPAS